MAVANLLPKKAVSNIYSEGLVRGEDTKNAITGPQGIADANMANKTAIVPQAQRGVKDPNKTAPGIDTLDFFISIFLSFSEST
ncbi:hypothetical protein SDC9_121478 [bioreactor metagenome]|uniref:Uncharacterized protein n=1 Tax=bioreactor metagenome TaxID=1076179 RepID=A0A645CC34_9ZZZZ